MRAKILLKTRFRPNIRVVAADIEEMENVFTVGEAVRSTCGNSQDDDEEEEKEDCFHLSPLKPSYDLIIATYGLHHGYQDN